MNNELRAQISSNTTAFNVQILGQGPRGERGYDSYELWLQQGNKGSIEDFFSDVYADISANNVVETTEKTFISEFDKARINGYIHEQILASTVWTINHSLNKKPSVSVVDTGDNLVIGEIEYLTDNQLVIRFTAEFSGKAYLN